MKHRFAFVIVAAMVFAAAFGAVQVIEKKVVEAPKEVGEHNPFGRFKMICSKVGLVGEQQKRAVSLWEEFARKMKAVIVDQASSTEAKDEALKNLHNNADRRFRNLLTKPQQGKLGELLRAEGAAYKAALAKAKKSADPKAAAEAAGGKTCWSCWPGKCDRGRWVD